MKASICPSVILACALLAAAPGASHAQTARSGGGNANTQLLQQMQQIASERTSLQAENERLKKELADVKKDRDGLKAGQQGLDRRTKDAAAALARSNEQRQATDQELTQSKARMQELIVKFKETVQKFREVETENAASRQTLATRDRDLSACVDRNIALYHLNEEILTRLDTQGVWSHLARAEPFTKIKRTQLENLADDYRARAQDQRVVLPGNPTSDAPASSPPGAPPQDSGGH
jgi:seryl-tRNA synthetase